MTVMINNQAILLFTTKCFKYSFIMHIAVENSFFWKHFQAKSLQ